MPNESCIPIPSIFTTPYDPQVKENRDIWEMDPLYRFEPDGAKILDINPDISQLFDKIGLGNFLRAFSGHNVEVT